MLKKSSREYPGEAATNDTISIKISSHRKSAMHCFDSIAALTKEEEEKRGVSDRWYKFL